MTTGKSKQIKSPSPATFVELAKPDLQSAEERKTLARVFAPDSHFVMQRIVHVHVHEHVDVHVYWAPAHTSPKPSTHVFVSPLHMNERPCGKPQTS